MFDEILPKPKSSSLVEDDRIDEPIVQDLNGSPSLQVNVSDEGYPKSLKEAIGHPIEQVIGELNERILRTYVKGMEVKQHYKHNMVAFLKKPNESVGFTEIVDFLKGTSLRTLANGTPELVASIDNTEYSINEASVRSKLQLAYATGISNLPDAEIYDGLATLGGYAGDYVPLMPAMLAGTAEDQGEGSFLLTDASYLLLYSVIINGATNSGVPLASVLTVAVCQNCLTRES
ncbi:hypothetical protein Tco_0647757 [Tanacetum coccineum]